MQNYHEAFNKRIYIRVEVTEELVKVKKINKNDETQIGIFKAKLFVGEFTVQLLGLGPRTEPDFIESFGSISRTKTSGISS